MWTLIICAFGFDKNWFIFVWNFWFMGNRISHLTCSTVLGEGGTLYLLLFSAYYQKSYWWSLFYTFNKHPFPTFSINWDILLPNKVLHARSIEGPITEKETRDSVFSLLGSDGFPLCFYYYFWDLVKEDLFQAFHFLYRSLDTGILRHIN